MLDSELNDTGSDSERPGANDSSGIGQPAPGAQPPPQPAGASDGETTKRPARRTRRTTAKAAAAEGAGAGDAAGAAKDGSGSAGAGQAGAGQAAPEKAAAETAGATKAGAAKTGRTRAGTTRRRTASAAAGDGAGGDGAASGAAASGPASGGPSTTAPAATPFSGAAAGGVPAATFQPPQVIFQPPAEAQAPPQQQARSNEPAASDGPPPADHGDSDGEQDGGGKRRRRRGSRAKGHAGDAEQAGEPDAAAAEADGSEGQAEGGAQKSGGQKSGAQKSQKAAQKAGAQKSGAKAGGQQAGSQQAEADDGGEANGDGEEGSGSRRRRRKRRRGSGSDVEQAGPDDPPNTVVHVRPGRSGSGGSDDSSNEVQSVRGSTRLEAKRQRRREGRESGRRRPPVITESEFLARREAVDRVMVVRQQGERTQIAVLEDSVLVEHYVDRGTHQSMVGNVYLGKVQNVLPSMEAAFVDIGKGRNAVLYAGEVNFDASGLEGESKRIESALKSGQSVLVQVTKDPVGHKGARLTSQVSLPGRYLVYVPGGSMMGISRKLPDNERTRLKQILKQVMPDDAGVIVRTAAEGASEEELAHDVSRLSAQWDSIERRSRTASPPELLSSEPDLTIRVVRDIFNEDFTRLVVSGDQGWDLVDEYVHYVAPHLVERLEHWQGDRDAFGQYRIDEQISKALDRKVWLPSGGSLVIDDTEAMTVIDVNTGKYTGQGGNLEETVTRNNLEAAEEIVRQLRLRDVGGIIVIDFIDMVLESNRELVLRRLLECLARDRTKHQVAEVTSLGLVQMTRKRVGSGLLEAFSQPCECCNGRGVIVSMDAPEAAASGGRGRGEGRGHGGGRSGRGNGKDNGKDSSAKDSGGKESGGKDHSGKEHGGKEHGGKDGSRNEPAARDNSAHAPDAAADGGTDASTASGGASGHGGPGGGGMDNGATGPDGGDRATAGHGAGSAAQPLPAFTGGSGDNGSDAGQQAGPGAAGGGDAAGEAAQPSRSRRRRRAATREPGPPDMPSTPGGQDASAGGDGQAASEASAAAGV
jgi:ribonuclease E